MTTQANSNTKNTSFKISDQVKKILHNRGLSKFFNFPDYSLYKEQAKQKNSFNIAYAIADLFTEEHQHESDLTEYLF